MTLPSAPAPARGEGSLDTASAAPVATAAHARFAMLDGWRAASILLVLAGHLLPLGPKRLALNAAAAMSGMVIFFILSGFLITRFLASGADLRVFLIRRFFRILPLAWAVMAVLLVVNAAGPDAWAANFLFYANLPPQRLVTGGGHLWSLCVEMQFYVGIALFVMLAGGRALTVAMPLAAAAITALRVANGVHGDIVTWFRVDEILAGGVLALIYAGRYGPAPQRLLRRLNPLLLLPLVFAASHEVGGALQYLRPYLAMLTVGASLYNPPRLLVRLFENRAAGYVATVSYALYVVHGALMDSWLGTGSTTIEKYAKRGPLIALTFLIAHLSTFRFEQPLVAYAKRATRNVSIRTPA